MLVVLSLSSMDLFQFGIHFHTTHVIDVCNVAISFRMYVCHFAIPYWGVMRVKKNRELKALNFSPDICRIHSQG